MKFSNNMNESFVKKTSNRKVSDLVKKSDEMISFSFGDLYPSSESPVGVVIKTEPLVILSFDERHTRVDELVDNFDYEHRKWSKHIGWYIPDVEEMKFIIENMDFLNQIIESVPSREEEWENLPWDDEDFIVPNFDYKPNPYKKELIKRPTHYNTREKSERYEGYWKIVPSYPRHYDFEDLPWTKTRDYPTRIIGQVNHIQLNSANESFTKKVSKVNNDFLKDKSKSVFFENMQDKDMIDFILRKKGVDIKSKDSEMCYYWFMPNDKKGIELLGRIINGCRHSDLQFNNSFNESPDLKVSFLRFEVLVNYDAEPNEKDLYLKIVFKTNSYYDLIIYWEDLDGETRQFVVNYLIDSKYEYHY